jgi:hypothetical protein
MAGKAGSGQEITLYDVLSVIQMVNEDNWLEHDSVSGYCTNRENTRELPPNVLHFKTPERLLLDKERERRLFYITHSQDAAEVVSAILCDDLKGIRSPVKGRITLTAVAKHFRKKWRSRKRVQIALEEIKRILSDL